jgi:hypothetical protein
MTAVEGFPHGMYDSRRMRALLEQPGINQPINECMRSDE